MAVLPATPPEAIDPPRTPSERALVKTQRKISRAKTIEMRHRDTLMRQMNEAGATQRRLSELLTLGAIAEGDSPLTENAVQRALRVLRTR